MAVWHPTDMSTWPPSSPWRSMCYVHGDPGPICPGIGNRFKGKSGNKYVCRDGAKYCVEEHCFKESTDHKKHGDLTLFKHNDTKHKNTLTRLERLKRLMYRYRARTVKKQKHKETLKYKQLFNNHPEKKLMHRYQKHTGILSRLKKLFSG